MNKAQQAELHRIEKAHGGRLHKSHVIKAARNAKNPLHSRFTWDRTKGWEKNLLAEAGELISEYTTIIMVGERPVRTRAMVSLSTDRSAGGGYRNVVDVLSNAQMRAVLLDDALRDLAVIQARYRHIVELAEVFGAVDNVRRRAKKKAA